MSACVLTPLAEEDLDEVLSFLAAEDPQAALRLLHKLESAFELLAAYPAAGHRRLDLSRNKRLRFWPVASHLVIYLQGSTPLRVVRILRGDRDVYALLRGLRIP
jgi:toxin ParE1/3/4